ncbi:hypothetical protein P8452_66596 [Trifolium repens]|nr:hypothetical protein P8452_66596 [Trifolium repens]
MAFACYRKLSSVDITQHFAAEVFLNEEGRQRIICCAFAKEDALSTNVALLEIFPCFAFEIANSINTPSFLLKGKTFLLSLNQCHYSFNISY